MLDPASIERLAESPERNDPLLNVALAEEGGGRVLVALARCARLGPEALDVIATRVAEEAGSLVLDDDSGTTPAAKELDRLLVVHPNAPRAVRDTVLARHPRDPFFVLSAAAHGDATVRALELGASWPSASALHDRPWLTLLDAARGHEGLLAMWAEDNELLREAAARIGSERSLLERLSRDPSRRVRRALASNAHASDLRQRLGTSDPAVEVRARALLPVSAVGNDGGGFATALRAMEEGGGLAADVRRALLGAGSSLDEEGAFLAALHLPKSELSLLISQANGHDAEPENPRFLGVGVGLGLRWTPTSDAHGEDEPVLLTTDIVHLVTKGPGSGTRLTGKARVAWWIAECLGRSHAVDRRDLGRFLAPGTLASDRMVLRRLASAGRASIAPPSLEEASSVPAAIVELCWRDSSIADDVALALCARVATSARRDRELPEDELDLLPASRPLPVLEQAVLAATARAPVSPRAALAAIALEPRRCRYVLSAMPTWKGVLTGARLARVLRSHAGALSATHRPGSMPPAACRPASVARWTARKLIEAEAAIAIAIGDLTAAELLRRLVSGAIQLDAGVMLAAGIEARAAIDGPSAFAQLLDHASSRRTVEAPALALWMLLEDLDRVRASSLIASAVDGLSVSGSVVPPAVCEALATLERRSPGRLENVHAQSPRGRATVASAIARAYRSFGGTRDEA